MFSNKVSSFCQKDFNKNNIFYYNFKVIKTSLILIFICFFWNLTERAAVLPVCLELLGQCYYVFVGIGNVTATCSKNSCDSEYQKQPPEVFYKKRVFLEILQNSQENAFTRVSFLIKLQTSDLQLYLIRDSGIGGRSETLLKKRL